MNFHYDYLIVGAGLFGATFAYYARLAGKRCLNVRMQVEMFIVKILKESMYISMAHISSIHPIRKFGIL